MSEAIPPAADVPEEFFDSTAIGIHLVGPDGTILRANRAELEMLGYTVAEYVGHNIAEFHADDDAIDDILRRLKAGETLGVIPRAFGARTARCGTCSSTPTSFATATASCTPDASPAT